MMAEMAVRCQMCGESPEFCRCSIKHLRVKQGIDVGGLLLPIRKTTFWENGPHVHRHYLTTDEDSDLLGFAAMELCCHGCGRAVVVKYVLPSLEETDRLLAALPEDERGRGLGKPRALIEQFQSDHVGCGGIGGNFLCPPARGKTQFLDWTKESLL